MSSPVHLDATPDLPCHNAAPAVHLSASRTLDSQGLTLRLAPSPRLEREATPMTPPFSEEKSIKLLQDAKKGEKPVGELCRDLGCGTASFYAWKKDGDTRPDEAQRLRQGDKANARLPRIVGQQRLEINAMRDALQKKRSRPPRGVPWRDAKARIKPERACFLVGLPKSTWFDQIKPCQDDELRQRMRDVALLYPRRGYRFIHALPLPEGWHVNWKKVRLSRHGRSRPGFPEFVPCSD